MKSIAAAMLFGNSGGGGINVIDNLTSTSSTDALSAKQGKVLKDSLDTTFKVSDSEVSAWGGRETIPIYDTYGSQKRKMTIDTLVAGLENMFSRKSHSHNISDVTNLQDSLDDLDRRLTDNQTGNLTTTCTISSPTRIIKNNKMVDLSIQLVADTEYHALDVFAILPQGFRPPNNIIVPCCVQSNWLLAHIYSDGTIIVLNDTIHAHAAIYIKTCYIID